MEVFYVDKFYATLEESQKMGVNISFKNKSSHQHHILYASVVDNIFSLTFL